MNSKISQKHAIYTRVFLGHNSTNTQVLAIETRFNKQYTDRYSCRYNACKMSKEKHEIYAANLFPFDEAWIEKRLYYSVSRLK